MANLTKAETKLFLYESKKNGVLNDNELQELLEMVNDAEYVEELDAIVEAVSDLAEDESDNSDLGNVLEAVSEYLENAKSEYENNEESVLQESVDETKLNIYESAKAGYITDEERDKLLEIVESVGI